MGDQLYFTAVDGERCCVKETPFYLGRGLPQLKHLDRFVSRNHVEINLLPHGPSDVIAEATLRGQYAWIRRAGGDHRTTMRKGKIFKLNTGDQIQLSKNENSIVTLHLETSPEGAGKRPVDSSQLDRQQKSLKQDGQSDVHDKRQNQIDESKHDHPPSMGGSEYERTPGNPDPTSDKLSKMEIQGTKGVHFMQIQEDEEPNDEDPTSSSSKQEKQMGGDVIAEESDESVEGQHSLGFPILSADALLKFNSDVACEVAMEQVHLFLATHRDPRIRLILVDEDNYELIQKHKDFEDDRLILRNSSVKDICSLKTLGHPCHYVVNSTNWRFRPNVGELNAEIHRLVPSLESESVRRFKAGKPCVTYVSPIPKDCVLRKSEGVRTVIQIVSPNMNKNKPDYLNDDYQVGRERLRLCYSEIFQKFYSALGFPPPPKSASMMDDVNEWTESRDKSPRPSDESKEEPQDLHFTMKEAPVYAQPDFSKIPQKSNWQNALRGYLSKEPKDKATQTAIYYEDEEFVAIYDKFPKARYHLLIMPRKIIKGAWLLEPGDVSLVKAMEHRAQWIISWLQKRNKQIEPFKIGFHAKPSLNQLHMHIISQDFDSVRLKNKKHWNSFTSAFFILASQLIEVLESGKKFKVNAAHYAKLLKQNLLCHRCGATIRTIPQLKTHIQRCVKPVRTISEIENRVVLA